MWLQISVLAAIGVALSTRFSLVVNLPAVLLIYIAGNLTRFMYPLEGRSAFYKGLVEVIGTVVPFLRVFDFREMMRLNNADGSLFLLYLRMTDTQFLEVFPNAREDRALELVPTLRVFNARPHSIATKKVAESSTKLHHGPNRK